MRAESENVDYNVWKAREHIKNKARHVRDLKQLERNKHVVYRNLYFSKKFLNTW